MARGSVALTHNEPCVAGHLGLVYRDDRLCAGESFLVVPGEMALGQFPVTMLERAEDKPRGFCLLHFFHNDLIHDSISAQVLLRLWR